MNAKYNLSNSQRNYGNFTKISRGVGTLNAYFFILFQIESPAIIPVARDDCRLNHQVNPSIFNISQAKYNHGQRRDSIVSGLTSFVSTPHAVTNSSHGLREIALSGIPFHNLFAIFSRIAFVS